MTLQCLNWTNSEDHRREFDLHFTCVEKLVEICGGLGALGMDGLLSKQIRW
jgi:hypothetical protein